MAEPNAGGGPARGSAPTPARFSSIGGPRSHPSAMARQKSPPIAQSPYHPTLTLPGPGDSREVPIYALPHWNETGIYLGAGVEYQFAASGQWLDRTIACGSEGCDYGHFRAGELAHLAGSLIGRLEDLWKGITRNKQADFAGSRCEEKLPWFALVGAVANSENPSYDGTPACHETFLIGKGIKHAPAKSGYSYGFANDSWHFYDNNRGSVKLKVKRA